MYTVQADGESEDETEEVVDKGGDMLCCCRCAQRRFGVTIAHACCKRLLSTQIRNPREALVPTNLKVASMQCLFFRDHLMAASELMLRAAERGVDAWEDRMPTSVSASPPSPRNSTGNSHAFNTTSSTLARVAGAAQLVSRCMFALRSQR